MLTLQFDEPLKSIVLIECAHPFKTAHRLLIKFVIVQGNNLILLGELSIFFGKLKLFMFKGVTLPTFLHVDLNEEIVGMALIHFLKALLNDRRGLLNQKMVEL